MKILLTTDTWVPVINGVVTSTSTLRAALTAQGHEVRVLTLSGDCHTYTKGRCDQPRLTGCRAGSTPGPGCAPQALNRAIRDLIDWRPDIIHSQCEFSTFAPARRDCARCGRTRLSTPITRCTRITPTPYSAKELAGYRLRPTIVPAFQRRGYPVFCPQPRQPVHPAGKVPPGGG